LNNWNLRRVALTAMLLLGMTQGAWAHDPSSTIAWTDGELNAVAYAPDGTLAGGGVDKSGSGVVHVWQAGTNALLRTLKGHSAAVTAMAFSPDSNTLATGSRDKTIKLWDVDTGSLIRTMTGHTQIISTVKFLGEGATLVSGSEDQSMRIWEATTGNVRRTFNVTGKACFHAVAWSGATRLIASRTCLGDVGLWDIRLNSRRDLAGHGNDGYGLSFTPDGSYLASGGADNSIRIWYSANGSLTRTLTGHTDHVNSLAYSPEGRLLASGSKDKTAKIWNGSNGRLITTVTGHLNEIRSVAFNRAGSQLATASKEGVRVWDATKF